MNHSEFIRIHLIESAATKERIADNCTENISRAVELIKTSIINGGKILICGNGGSAADAQHLAAEFIIRLNHDIIRPAIPAIALTTDTSILTAGGNDIGFSNIFSRQVEALGKAGDIFLGISTSGNSDNVLRAALKAKQAGMVTIGFLGNDGGKADKIFDHSINIPSDNTQHIQEGHITVGHIICELVERDLYT